MHGCDKQVEAAPPGHYYRLDSSLALLCLFRIRLSASCSWHDVFELARTSHHHHSHYRCKQQRTCNNQQQYNNTTSKHTQGCTSSLCTRPLTMYLSQEEEHRPPLVTGTYLKQYLP